MQRVFRKIANLEGLPFAFVDGYDRDQRLFACRHMPNCSNGTLTKERLQKGAVYVGHRSIGWSDYQDLDPLTQPFFVLTWREPFSRIISLHNFRLAWRLKALNEKLIASGLQAEMVFDYLAQTRNISVMDSIESSEVKFLIPRACPLQANSSDVQAVLAVGLHNMVRCEVAVAMEHMEDFKPQMKMHAPHLLNASLEVPHVNPTRARINHFISNSTADLIRSYPQFHVDARLHSFIIRLASARVLHARSCEESAALCTSSCSMNVSKQELDLLRTTIDEKCKA